MALRHVEHRGDLALLRAMPDQARVAAAAERKRKGVEKDGFARAGLAGQHGKPAGKLDIEPFDQDDVTDRKTRQHRRLFLERLSQGVANVGIGPDHDPISSIGS